MTHDHESVKTESYCHAQLLMNLGEYCGEPSRLSRVQQKEDYVMRLYERV